VAQPRGHDATPVGPATCSMWKALIAHLLTLISLRRHDG
jgi:hypothetical protein